MIDESLLPDELQSGGGELARPKRVFSDEDRADRLAKLSAVVVSKREEAVKARKDSGIETVWLACEEAYLGIDDANRGEFAGARWAKPTSMQGPVSTSDSQQSSNKSTAFVRLTSRYVDMGAAKLSEIVLPIDDKAFAFGPSPVADPVVTVTTVGQQSAPNPATAQPAQVTPIAQATAGGQQPPAAAAPAIAMPAPGQPPMQGGAAAQPVDPTEQQQEEATQKAKKAEKRVYDWMVESRYPLQMRKVIHDSARIGVGVLKAPFPDQRTRKAFSVKGDKGVLEIVTKVSPAMKWVDPWNLFPAPGCGEDIHSGDYIFERDFLSPASLRKLKNLRTAPVGDKPGQPIYIPAAIDQVLAEGPNKCKVEGNNPNDQKADNSRFTIWHMTGTLNRENMEALGAPGIEDLPDELVQVFVIITMANDTVIRVAFNPLEKTGNFPYRTFPWSRRAGHWAGVGPGEQISMPQRMANAGLRAWMNNAGKAAGSQIVLDQRSVIPADGDPAITPDKLWYYVGEGMSDDIHKVFALHTIPDLGASLLRILQEAFQLAEQQSNIPLVAQGQTGANDPETFGQSELLNDNAKTLLREKAYMLDDCITEPVVQDLYEWLLLDDTVPDDEKGDFEINARGSIAMVEKAIQEQTFPMLIQAAAQNPTYGQNPAKLFAEWMRAKRFNPELTKYTPQELADLQNRQPPEAPVVQAAKINVAGRLHEKDMDVQLRREIAANDHDRGVAYEQALAEQDQVRLDMANKELELKRELAMLDYANKRNLTLEQVKAELAQTAMKLQAQREISRDNLAVAVHKHHNPAPAPNAITPPTEPAGRAEPGQSFAQ
jgi:hypothetical protein